MNDRAVRMAQQEAQLPPRQRAMRIYELTAEIYNLT